MAEYDYVRDPAEIYRRSFATIRAVVASSPLTRPTPSSATLPLRGSRLYTGRISSTEAG